MSPDIEAVIARLRGLASEADMYRLIAKEHNNQAAEMRWSGEKAGLWRAVDLLEGREKVPGVMSK